MPRASLDLSLEGGLVVEGRLTALAQRLDSMPVASAIMIEELEKYQKRTWGRGEHVTESTDIRWPNRQPLENTGMLKDSFTNSQAPGAVREITPYGFKWGTSISYARFLQKGTRKMQPKPVVRLRALRAVVGYQMRKYILGALGPEFL